MSRTNQGVEQSGVSNPAKKFVEFNGEKGAFTYYCKTDKKDVVLPYPVSFLIVDQLHTVKGFCRKSQSSIYSNEVHNMNEEIMDVRRFKGDNKSIAKGKYPDIKTTVSSAGGNYYRSIYVLLHVKDAEGNTEWELANISFKGATFYEWSQFLENFKGNKYESMIFVKQKDLQAKKNGNIDYVVPTFGAKPLSKDNADQNVLLTKADKSDLVLQNYFQGKKEESTNRSEGIAESKTQPQQEKQQASAPVQQEQASNENVFIDTDDSDDDLPF